MKAVAQFFRQMLSEDNGKASLKRLLTLGIFVVFCISYLRKIAWTKEAADMVDIPEMWALVILGSLGIMGGITAWERKNGTKTEDNDK